MTNNQSAQGPRADLIIGWTDLWNGELAKAEHISSGKIHVHFGGTVIGEVGDTVKTATELANLIETFRSTRPDLVYSVVEARTTRQWGFCVWNASLGQVDVGGIDTFAFDAHGITHVRSVTGERPMDR